MKKILGFAGAIALSVIPTPNFSGELEKKEIMSVTEKLLPQIGEKYYSLDKKEKKEYRKGLNKYLDNFKKEGVSEGFGINNCTHTKAFGITVTKCAWGSFCYDCS